MSKHPSWCCQKCGAPIGWIGRLFADFNHKCRAAATTNERTE